MKFLFAAGGHACKTAREAGFDGKTNGELLALAEPLFDALITIDRNTLSTKPDGTENCNPDSLRTFE
ncbi:MAG TPA: hypothetical protein VHW72_15200 [Candidatus Angelobacter sp.]|nr:hypothetical protein [Candidatus Angelobacter sp.]